MKVARTPKVTCVILSEDDGGIAVADAFDLTTSATGVAARAHDLAQQLAGRLPGLGVDVIVIQRADFSQARSNQQGRSDRLIVEGALTYAAFDSGAATFLRNGKETGAACGTDKETALAEGKALDARRQEAAAAALSGLRRSEEVN